MRKTPTPISDGLINNMRILRSQGKTNREIAAEMNLCTATVRRHIGNQPSGLRANYGSIVSHVTDVETPPPVAITKKSSLRLVAQTKIMEGNHYHFALDNLGNITITYKSQDEKIHLDKDGMERFITELMDAYMELCNISGC